jgi:hypothetical protein
MVFHAGSLTVAEPAHARLARLRRRPEASATMARAGCGGLVGGSSGDDADLADRRAPVGHGHLLGGATRKRARKSNHGVAPDGHHTNATAARPGPGHLPHRTEEVIVRRTIITALLAVRASGRATGGEQRAADQRHDRTPQITT